MFTTNTVLHFVGIIHRMRKKVLLLRFSWTDPSKSLVFKKGQDLQRISRLQGSSSLLLYNGTLDGLEKQKLLISIKLIFENI